MLHVVLTVSDVMKLYTLTHLTLSNLLLDITLTITMRPMLMNMLMTMLRVISNLNALTQNALKALILIVSLMTLRRTFLLGIKAAARG
jgi:hypothetical protein